MTGRSNDESQSRIRDLEAELAAKSEFISGLSHEIRTPLTGVVGMAEVLSQTRLDDDQRRCVRTIHQSAESLLTTLNIALATRSPAGGELDLQETDFDLRRLVDDVVDLSAETAQRKGLELICDLPPRITIGLHGDALHLRQILTTMLSNAIKCTNHGVVILRVSVIDESSEKITIAFELHITGAGILDDGDSLFFEPIEQPAGGPEAATGNAFGLDICRKLTDRMGGELTVSNAPDHGASIRSALPFTKSNSITSSWEVDEKLHGLVTLLAVENEAARDAIGKQLHAWEIEYRPAATLADAKTQLERRPFDLVIIDHDLDRDEGIELVQSIRDITDWTPDVVLLTSIAASRDPLVREALDEGVIVPKPCRQADLYDAICVALGYQDDEGTEAEFRNRRLQGRRVLLVEDNAMNREVLLAMLDNRGLTLSMAIDGEDALEMVDQNKYDLILMDCQLPGMDGLEATRHIRDRERDAANGTRIPIIAITAQSAAAERDRCLQAGMDDFLSKPIRSEDLLGTIARWLPRQDAEHTTSISADAGELPDRIELDADALDAVRALQRPGRPDVLGRIVMTYLEESSRLIHGITAACAIGDFATIELNAHSLKSSSRTLGAKDLADRCARLEKDLRAERRQDVDTLVREIMHFHALTHDALRGELATVKS